MDTNQEQELIKASLLRDAIDETRSFIVWDGSIEQKWNGLAWKLNDFTNSKFWISGNDTKECGYYIKFIDLKNVLEEIYSEILKFSGYKGLIYMMYNYNKIVSFVNSEISPPNYIATLKKCNNQYCLFSKECICCNKEQDNVAPDNLDCTESIRADYYEFFKKLRKDAEEKIETMNMNQLIEFMNDKRWGHWRLD